MRCALFRRLRRRTGIPDDQHAHAHGGDGLGDGHGEPDGAGPEQGRQRINQRAAEHQPAQDRNRKRGAGLHQGLEIVGGENIERQQQERNAVAAQNGGCDAQDVPGGGHENADEPVGKQKDEQRPHRAEKGGGHQRVLQRRADASPFARAEAGRKDGLGGLAHAVCTALDHGAHVHDHTVHGQCVRAQSLQDLAVEQHGQDAHGDVEKERGKAGGQNLPQLGSGISEADGPQRAAPGEKVGQHHREGDARADGCCQPRAEYAHVTGEHKKVIAEHIEDAARQHRRRGKPRRAVVAQERRQHLVEQEQRHHEFDGEQILLRQRQQRVPRAEQAQQRRVEKCDGEPAHGGKEHGARQRGGKILVAFFLPARAPRRA